MTYLFAALVAAALNGASSLGTIDPPPAVPTQSGPSPQRGTGPHRDFFPPWEGSGTYVFGPLLLDLNRRLERWEPGRTSPLIDCSTEEVFCLTSRRAQNPGVVAFAVPRQCSDIRVGDSWSAADVRTTVLARGEPRADAMRDVMDYHMGGTSIVYYLGDDSNPRVVYEYWTQKGVVAVHHGLGSRSNLVADVRGGLDPNGLPRQHRFDLSTFDRLARCRRSG